MDIDTQSYANEQQEQPLGFAPIPDQRIVYQENPMEWRPPAPDIAEYTPEQQGEKIFEQYVKMMQQEMFKKHRGASSKPFAKPGDFRDVELSGKLRAEKLFHQFQRRKDYFHDLAFTRAIVQSNSGFTVGSGSSDKRSPSLNA